MYICMLKCSSKLITCCLLAGVTHRLFRGMMWWLCIGWTARLWLCSRQMHRHSSRTWYSVSRRTVLRQPFLVQQQWPVQSVHGQSGQEWPDTAVLPREVEVAHDVPLHLLVPVWSCCSKLPHPSQMLLCSSKAAATKRVSAETGEVVHWGVLQQQMPGPMFCSILHSPI